VHDNDLDTIAALADGVRRALYRFVAGRSEPVSKDEAADHVGISRSLASYHLDRLAEDGLLAVTYARRSGRRGPGAGRPAKLYAIAPVDFNVQLPPRDDTLLARLLAGAVEADDSGTTRAALMAGARAEGKRAAAEHDGSRDALVTLLADRGYGPQDSGAEIRMRNCPFHHLVDDHRDLVCALNLELLDAALGPLADGYRAVLEPTPGHCCVVLRRTVPA
jgi:predicted ArsR family transcriptional regulator